MPPSSVHDDGPVDWGCSLYLISMWFTQDGGKWTH